MSGEKYSTRVQKDDEVLTGLFELSIFKNNDLFEEKKNKLRIMCAKIGDLILQIDILVAFIATLN